MIRAAGRALRNFLAPGLALPLELIVFVTRRCNFRCPFCFVDKELRETAGELTVGEMERIASRLSPPLSVMLTGGEPFLRDDLAEIVAAFAQRARPQVISVATNGFSTSRVLEQTERALVAPGMRSRLMLTISFDGIGAEHDRARGVDGAYDRALDTAGRCGPLRKSFPNLRVGANLTLTAENQDRAADACRVLREMGLFDFVSFNLVRGKGPSDYPEGVDVARYRELRNLIHSDGNRPDFTGLPLIEWLWWRKERYQAWLIERIYATRQWQGIACEAGRGIGVVDAGGNLYACEMLSRSLGNVREADPIALWRAPATVQFARSLRRDRCFCTHECFLSASINTNPAGMLRCLAHGMGRSDE